MKMYAANLYTGLLFNLLYVCDRGEAVELIFYFSVVMNKSVRHQWMQSKVWLFLQEAW